MKRPVFVALVLTVLIASFLRLYKLDKIPPSLNWDETAAGYNAYTIANWGRDEWGQKFPIVFTSFRDDKHPVHIYITALVVKAFGLSDFTTRLSGAVIGILAVLVIFFLAREFFDSFIAAIFSALFLALSPYHLQFSRGLWEVNFALFFFLLGLLLFYLAIRKKSWMLPLSIFCFGLSFFSYHSSKVVVPPILLLLIIFYFKSIIKTGKFFYLSILVLLLFVGLTIKEPRILGFARAQQNRFSEDAIYKTKIYKMFHNETLAIGEITIAHYPAYFSYEYLFEKGDPNPRHLPPVIGQFYKTTAIFVILGLIMLWEIGFRKAAILFTWLILAPVPSALASGSPNSARALFMMGSIELISAYGLTKFVEIAKSNKLKIIIVVTVLASLLFEFTKYIKYYYDSYAKRYAIEWQYGMKDMVLYVKAHPEFYRVYVDKIRQQPYIFFLYYLKTPLPEFLKTVRYDETISKSYNTVVAFDRYRFGNWDPIQSYPSEGTLYAITPSYYYGLAYKRFFDVLKLVKYPDGNDAFYLVTGYLK